MAQFNFADPTVASVRVPVGLNPDGDIAVSGEDIAGTKSLQFTYTKTNATADEILYGTSDTSNITTTGIVSTFINFLLDATADPLGMKRTIVQNTVYGEEG